MPDLPFVAAEYAGRLQKTRAEMALRGLDAIFVTDPSNMAWLTGYDGWSFYVHQGVLLTHEGEPVWWGRAMDAVGAQRLGCEVFVFVCKGQRHHRTTLS